MALRIAVCCGGGFSSSALAKRMQKEAERKGLTDRGNFRYVPFIDLEGVQDEFDVAMLCPHLQYKAVEVADRFRIPLYIIPPRLYGMMPAEDLLEDAEDVCAIWGETHTNLVAFPDDPPALSIKRTRSHRREAARLTTLGAGGQE